MRQDQNFGAIPKQAETGNTLFSVWNYELKDWSGVLLDIEVCSRSETY